MPNLVRNTNRIVKITRNLTTSTRNAAEASSWRNALSNIMGNYNSNSYAKITEMKNLNVNNDIELLMKADPAFSFENKSGTPVSEFLKKNSSLTKVATAAGGFAAALDRLSGGASDTKTSGTFSPWVANVPAWKNDSAKGLEFEYEFSFALGQYGFWNAKEEVVKPLLNLVAPTIAQHLNAFMINGPFPDEINLLANLLTNAFSTDENGKLSILNEAKSTASSISDRMGNITNLSSAASALGNSLEDIGNFLEALILYSYKSYTYNVSFGNFITINNVIIRDSDLSFSTETDEEGWPISGSCKLKFEGVIPPALTSSGTHNLALRFGTSS